MEFEYYLAVWMNLLYELTFTIAYNSMVGIKSLVTLKTVLAQALPSSSDGSTEPCEPQGLVSNLGMDD